MQNIRLYLLNSLKAINNKKIAACHAYSLKKTVNFIQIYLKIVIT